MASFRRPLFRTLRRTGVTTVLAHAGYDSESNHRFARDGCGVISIIPATHGRRTDKLPPTPHRRRMKRGLGRRYGQRNPVRPGLCDKAQDWPWRGTRHDANAASKERPAWLLLPEQWPVACRRDWRAWVDSPQTSEEEESVRLCVRRDRPFGRAAWVANAAERLGLESTLRPRGRPTKQDRNKSASRIALSKASASGAATL